MPKLPKPSEAKFEDSLKRLEDIVNQLESREAPLDESLALFEEGVGLARFCQTRLDEAKKKIEILNKATGELQAFEGELPHDA